MDGDGRIEFKSQLDLPVTDLEHDNLEHLLEAVEPADHNRFLALP